MHTQTLNSAFLSDLDCVITARGIEDHSRHVANMSRLIYDNLSCFEQEAFSCDELAIYSAGLYHDIGKAFVNVFYPNVLDKEKWNNIDRMIIQEHTSIGSCILYILAVERNQDVSGTEFHLLHDAILFHHERSDGSGYLRLHEEQIPPIGQLVAVADSFSAGMEKRIYKESKDAITVFEELQHMPFNKAYVDALGDGIGYFDGTIKNFVI